MFKRIIAIILLVVCLAGCGIYGSKPNKGNKDEYSPIGYPNVTEYGNGNYHYVVDNNTGVVYLRERDVYHAALSVMFDENGDVITVNKLKERYNLYDGE